MKWTALAFLALLAVSWIYENGADTFALLVNRLFRRFPYNGLKGHTVGQLGETPTSIPPDHSGSPSRVVDASNSPNKIGIRYLKSYDIQVDEAEMARIRAEFDELEERRRMSGLTEIHRVNTLDPVLPPPSRSIRRQIH